MTGDLDGDFLLLSIFAPTSALCDTSFGEEGREGLEKEGWLRG
jgi:hypothetical protein